MTLTRDATCSGFHAGIASARDAEGRPIHRGWAASGGRRRWMAPFILGLLAEEPSHGYALIGRLEAMGVADGEIDVGQVYRTLHCLEALGHVRSTWSAEPVGQPRRAYELTDIGCEALQEWGAVMAERARLIGEFEARCRGATTLTGVDVEGSCGRSRRGADRDPYPARGGEEHEVPGSNDPRGARAVVRAAG